MLSLSTLLGVWTTLGLLASVTLSADPTTSSTDSSSTPRPIFMVPGLIQIRDILAQLEAPILSALTDRMNLATDPSLYANGGQKLLQFVNGHEKVAQTSGRFNYGKLEYPFTLPQITPDVTTRLNPFPPGRFHQDSFNGNSNITAFYIATLVPFFSSTTSVFYHLDNSTQNDDAVLNLDATLLALLSHRAHIGKVVAETKYAGNVTAYTNLIKAKDATTIRTLLTNTTQETSVLAQASTAASAFSGAWTTSGARLSTAFPTNLQNAAAVLFRELIDITTQIEIQYILGRLT